tara:strand:- start:65 stop:439 length:375 start_codon:yes stop_codon:yes gene_type:complete
MELNAEKITDEILIKTFEKNLVVVGELKFTKSFILGSQIRPNSWDIKKFSDLSPIVLENLNSDNHDLIIIGTGTKQYFPDRTIQKWISSSQIAIEFMTSRSACITYNLLALDHRKIIAGIILPL